MKNHIPEAVSASDLAKILPISARRIRQLENEGILSRDEAGLYPVAKSLQGFISYRENLIEKQAATPRSSEALQRVRYELLAAKLGREEETLIELTEALDAFDVTVGKLTQWMVSLPVQLGRTDDERTAIAATMEGDIKRVVQDFAAIRYQLATGREAE